MLLLVGWIGAKSVYWFRPDKLRVDEVECGTTTLDSFNLEPVFVKVDVEGLEYAVLEGARQTLTRAAMVSEPTLRA